MEQTSWRDSWWLFSAEPFEEEEFVKRLLPEQKKIYLQGLSEGLVGHELTNQDYLFYRGWRRARDQLYLLGVDGLNF